MNKWLALLLIIAGLAGAEESDKYRCLERMISLKMENARAEFKRVNPTPRSYYVWSFVNLEDYPNYSCQGDSGKGEKFFQGTFFSAGGKARAINVIGKRDPIIAQVFVLFYEESIPDKKVRVKHFQVFKYKYDLETGEWTFLTVDREANLYYYDNGKFTSFSDPKCQKDENDPRNNFTTEP